MNVIIFADNFSQELAPLSDMLPVGLLPVAGKPLLLHALESLHRSGLRDVTIVSSVHGRLQKETDTGPLLGMRITFANAAPSLADATTHSLVLDLARWPDTHWPDVLERFGDLEVHAQVPLRLISAGSPVALLLPPRHCGPVQADWKATGKSGMVDVQAGALNLMCVDSLRHYFDSNFALLRGAYTTLRSAGRKTGNALYAGPKAQAEPGSIQAECGYLGQRCRIDRTARLVGEAIVGDNAVIGRNAVVDHSIVLDGTYLGENTHCRNAIICKDLFIRVDTGTFLRLDDKMLFGSVR